LSGGRRGLEIRAATGADTAGLSELLAAGGLVVAPQSLAERLAALRGESGIALLAADWGPPSGVIVLHWRATLEHPLATAWITTLLVAPDERRKGLGRLLLKAGAQAARAAGCGTLHLAAAPGQTALVSFCGRAGFAEVGAVFTRPLRRRG
jgi:GNAT superfamily N-acetyltransferase